MGRNLPRKLNEPKSHANGLLIVSDHQILAIQSAGMRNILNNIARAPISRKVATRPKPTQNFIFQKDRDTHPFPKQREEDTTRTLTVQRPEFHRTAQHSMIWTSSQKHWIGTTHDTEPRCPTVLELTAPTLNILRANHSQIEATLQFPWCSAAARFSLEFPVPNLDSDRFGFLHELLSGHKTLALFCARSFGFAFAILAFLQSSPPLASLLLGPQPS